MEHKGSIFVFEHKGVEWRVEYYYKYVEGFYDHPNRLAARVFEDGNLYHDYGYEIPYTKTENPTKSQAKELIAKAKVINKKRDERDKKIDGILK